MEDLTVNFTDLSSNSPTAWLWNFGDGGTSTQQNPVYTYLNEGLYTVTLTATNGDGNGTMVKSNYITVKPLPPPPTPVPFANFLATPLVLILGQSVQFTDDSLNTPTSWLWNFGDGNTSTLQNPNHIYAAAGNYTVTLIATNGFGSNTITKTNYITVNISAPVADFTASSIFGNIPLTVNFTDLSTGAPTSWLWDFKNDGSATSTLQSPSYTYTTAGTYTVKLTVANSGGSNTITKTNYILVAPNPDPIPLPGTAYYAGSSVSGDGNNIAITSIGDFSLGNGSIYITTDNGIVWNVFQAGLAWRPIAFSQNGTKILAGVRNGFLYTSTDSGLTWTQRESSRNWTSGASSLDGVNLVAAAFSDFIYTSSDSGVTWTQRAISSNWRNVACSSTGTTIIASSPAAGVYLSSDAGANWTAQTLADGTFFGAACSSNGTKLFAVSLGGGIHVSGDSGSNWTRVSIVQNWVDIACSGDGSIVVAVASASPTPTVAGPLYRSSDSGATWTNMNIQALWTTVNTSSDGRVWVATADKAVYISIDYGVTWVKRVQS